MKRNFLWLLAALFMTAPAAAQKAPELTADVGGQKIMLPSPQGECALDDKKPDQARLLQLVRGAIGTNDLAGYFVECNELAQWMARKRKYIDDFTQVQVPAGSKGQDLSGKEAGVIKDVCGAMREQAAASLAGMQAELQNNVAKAAKSVGASIKLNEVKFIGVMEETSEACYTSMLQAVTGEGGEALKIAAVLTPAIARGKLVLLYSFGKFKDETTYGELLVRSKAILAAVLAANK